MRKLNLSKLRCSKESPSSRSSNLSSKSSNLCSRSSNVSSKNQSQATISSFFSGSPSSSNGKRTVNEIVQDEHCDITHSQTSKKQRLLMDASTLKGSNDRELCGNKEGLSSSLIAKLSCFKNGSKSDVCEKHNKTLDVFAKHVDTTSIQGGFCNKDPCESIAVQSQTEDMEQDSTCKDFDVKKFLCTSHSIQKSVEQNSAENSKRVQSNKSFNVRSKSAYTPLELQFLEVKSKYPDVVLFVECGYRYRFFGEHAEIAAKELNITCHLDHNFQTASIPTHRLHVHVKRLVSKGYKVGVVKQTETAALKAVGDNRSKVFTRELHALYTKTTLVGEDMKTVEEMDEVDPVQMGSGYLMCLFEVALDSQLSSDKSIFSFVAVQPSTGDVVYDEFEDGPSYSEVESCFEHISPEELLLPESLSVKTENFIREYVTRIQRPEDSIRIERMSDQHFDDAMTLKHIMEFYDEKTNQRNRQLCKLKIPMKSLAAKQDNFSALEIILRLPKSVQICLAALCRYLEDFKLEKVLKLASNFTKFSTPNKFMKLSGQTLRNLEIFKNQTNGMERGSLFCVINHTITSFGRRLLKKWILQPLMNVREIERRLDAVSELSCSDALCLSSLKGLLSQLPDLERGLCTIYHRKSTPAEFLSIARSLVNLVKHLESHRDLATSEVNSPLLRNVFTEAPNYLGDVDDFLKLIDEKAAKDGDKTKMFVDQSQFPAIMKCSMEIERILMELKNHRSEFRKVLNHPSLDYCCVAGNEFLIEVRNANLRMVPADWVKISSTKQVSRFRTPYVEEKFTLLCQRREQLALASQEAWLEFLTLFSEGCCRYRRAVHLLATIDCLFSLAAVAKQAGFIRPVVTDSEAHIYIKKGRHPVIDALLPENEQFVPNDTQMNENSNRCMIITGPNMGGKSSYIKQVALLVILAQIGSYVPAEEADVGVLDAVFTRMGASDNIYKGQSTFMLELQETSEIISQATPKSLVILDELGRGTSTHDGTAIACATLHHFVTKVCSLTLFVTHYPSLAELENLFPSHVSNNHMGFMTSEDECHQNDSEQREEVKESPCTSPVPSVTFLYHLVNGAAARSYGLHVAHLAGIPSDILKVAAAKSQELENDIVARCLLNGAFQEICSESETPRQSVERVRLLFEKSHRLFSW